MAVLPAQTIRALCIGDGRLIIPYEPRGVFDGMTWGLGPCTYDMRVNQNIVLLPIWMLPLYAVLCLLRLVRPQLFPRYRCFFTLASTIEHVILPNDICGVVMDKSSWARRGLSVFNTKFDPGFFGHPTLELHNCGLRTLRFRVGTPICQFKFERLEAPTDTPYQGRYQGQGIDPTPYKPAKGAWQ